MLRALFNCFLLTCLISTAAAAPTHELVTRFDALPYSPGAGAIVAGPSGRLWGTTILGGAYNFGTIYSMDRDSGDWRIELSFTSNRTYDRGARPEGGLTYDGGTYLWGTTQSGGANGFGTVFKFNGTTGQLTTLVDFTNRNPGNPGATAVGQLVSDGLGYFWGVTTNGGNSNGYGSIFKIDVSTGVLSSVVQFSSTGPTNTGAHPLAGLVADGLGYLWGTTSEGGSSGRGTIFKVNTQSGQVTTLFEFSSGGGTTPSGALSPDGNGFFWGTTVNGGAQGYGSVFKINIGTGAFSSVLEFTNTGTTNNGASPYGALVDDGVGYLWGTTYQGGIIGAGTVFKINKSTGILTTVFQLRSAAGSASTGTNPKAGLLNDGAGFIWGTTGQNSFGTGTVFKANISTGTFATVHGFATNLTSNKGLTPQGGLVADGKGFLWGTTRSGGPTLQGTIFKTDDLTGATTTVVEFRENGTRGAYPSSELLNDGKGFFWGTTEAGGSTGGYGTVFKVDIATGALTTVVDFGSTGPIIGSAPRAGLTSDRSGYFWGTTYSGGNDGAGSLFKINQASGALTTVYQFSTPTFFAPNGQLPIGSLIYDGAGYLWGTTSSGGPNAGAIYKVQSSTGQITKVAEFTSSPNTNGVSPYAGLADGGNGYFFGTTQKGGVNDFGTVFKVQTSSGTVTKLVDFSSNGLLNKGAYPWAELTSDGIGSFWGTTNQGGAANSGTVFKMNSSTGGVQTVVEFSGTGNQTNTGANPGYGPLLLNRDGNYYGTTVSGGPGGAGTVFRIRLGPTPETKGFSHVTSEGALLEGTINPNGTASAAGFEWGTDPQLLTKAVVSAGLSSQGTAPEAFSASLAGLAPDTVYYFRARGTNPENTIPQIGTTLSFRTGVLDGDGDGLPDAWEIQHFGTTSGHSAMDDQDHDGLVELLEYAFGLNPIIPDANVLPPPQLEDGFLTITITKVPHVSYVVQSAGSLAEGDWSAASTTVLFETETSLKVRDNVKAGASARFLRVQVSAP